MEGQSYLRDHTLGSVVRSSITIYRRYFWIICGVFILPMLPLILFSILFREGEAITAILIQIWQIFAVAPITVAVSDICLGNTPNIWRCYKRLLNSALRIFLTFILFIIVIIIGIVLLVVPGIVISVLSMFTMTVVVLEGRSGFGAIKRSIDLNWGYSWRNFGIMIVVSITFLTLALLGGALLGFILTGLLGLDLSLSQNMGLLWGSIVAPFFTISIVLLYYDMRSRKENYDAAALAGDMMV